MRYTAMRAVRKRSTWTVYNYRHLYGVGIPSRILFPSTYFRSFSSTRLLLATQLDDARYIPGRNPAFDKGQEIQKRLYLVHQENNLLWNPVHTLYLNKRVPEAIKETRTRLVDPLSYFPSRTTASADELRVHGHYNLARLLSYLHILKDSKQPDPSKAEEIAQACSLASRGCLQFHSVSRGVPNSLANTYLHAILVYERNGANAKEAHPHWEDLVNLLRLCLTRAVQNVKGLEAKDHQKEWRDMAKLIIGPLQKLSLGFPLHEASAVYKGLEEAVAILQEYLQQYPDDPALDRPQIEVLLSQAMLIHAGEASEEQAAKVYANLKNCQALMARIRTSATKAEDPQYLIIENFYGEALERLGIHLPRFSAATAQGLVNTDILSESADTYRRLSGLPDRLENIIPPTFRWEHAYHYSLALKVLGQESLSYPKSVDLIQRSLQILYIGAKARAGLTPSLPSYSTLLELEDWSDFECHELEWAFKILDTMVHVRFGKIPGMKQEEVPEQEAIMDVVKKEAALAVRIADLFAEVAGPQDETSAKLAQGRSKMVLAEVEFYEIRTEEERARLVQMVQESKVLLESFTETGSIEELRRQGVEEANWIINDMPSRPFYTKRTLEQPTNSVDPLQR